MILDVKFTEQNPVMDVAFSENSASFDAEFGEFYGSGGGVVIPTIGENGNWFINDEDTGMPSRGEKGEQGDDGVSVTHRWDGTKLIVTSASGTSSSDLKGEKGTDGYTPIKGVDYFDGKDGADGKNGYTPVKGTDYYTEADKAEMVSAVIAALPVYNGEVAEV